MLKSAYLLISDLKSPYETYLVKKALSEHVRQVRVVQEEDSPHRSKPPHDVRTFFVQDPVEERLVHETQSATEMMNTYNMQDFSSVFISSDSLGADVDGNGLNHSHGQQSGVRHWRNIA